MLTERAHAKVNLTLRVLGRRADGYHLLDSLVGFARRAHDDLTLDPGPGLSLAVDGPTAQEAGTGENNLVMRAARALMERREGVRAGVFHLSKRLPVAAGLGGGSADAAAALRLIARANGMAPDDPSLFAAARATGADVPVCLASRLRAMGGIGDDLGPELASPALHAVLVNPRAACPTGEVFRALGAPAGARFDQPSPEGAAAWPNAGLLDRLAGGRNDLEAPAMRLVPAIGEVLAALRGLAGAAFARMSGSGATCFALFADGEAAAAAARDLRRARPAWWIAETEIG